MSIVDPPAHWARAALSEIAEVRLGRQRSPARASGPNMMPYLRAANVTWRGLDFDDVKEMDFTAAEVDTYRLRPGDILLAEASGSASEVGKPGMYPDAQVTRCFQNTLIRVRAAPEISRFLHLHFAKDAVLGEFARASRGVGIHHLGAEALSSWAIALPPVPEQQLLADAVDSYLSRLDAAIASLERVETKLKAYRASVLKAAVEGRLVPTEAELARKEKRAYEPAEVLLARILKERRRRWEAAELAKLKAAGKTPRDQTWRNRYKEPEPPDTSGMPTLPTGWCWASVEQVGDVLLGRQRSPDYLTGRWARPYLRVANIKDDRIDFDDIEEMDFDETHFAKYRLTSGDILVSEGQSPHRVGESAIYRGQVEGLCFQKTLHRFRAVPGGPSPEFAQVVFRANVMLGVFQRMASITTNIAHLTLEKFEASQFPLPPAAEQERIVVEVERLLTIATAVETATHADRRRVGRLRQCILKSAFEGKLVDQAPTDEPAEKLVARIRAQRASAPPTKKRARKTTS